MIKCVIYTCAYNAEKTLTRAIQSMFSQTYKNWVWYIVDNGSTDGTGKLIKRYAGNDARIVPLANKENHVWKKENTCWNIISKHKNDGYFCWLDADDEYKYDFLEKAIISAEKNNIDIVCSGCDFIDAETQRISGVRNLSSGILLDSQKLYDEYFTTYYQYMRTTWGKLYRLSVLHEIDQKELPRFPYGWDTMFCFKAFYQAKRIFILPESLYKYYIYSKSVSYDFDLTRIESDRILFDNAIDFLNFKCGFVSARNEDYLLSVYMYAITDTLTTVLCSEINLAQKLDNLCDIFMCEQAKKLAAKTNLGENLGKTHLMDKRRELFATIADWMFGLNEVPKNRMESFIDLGEFVCAGAEYTEGREFFNKLKARFLKDQRR